MNATTWAESNERYLAASLQWLRLKLQALSGQLHATPANPPNAPGLLSASADRTTVVTPTAPTAPAHAPAWRTWFSRGPSPSSGGAVATSPASPQAAAAPLPVVAAPAPGTQALADAAAQRERAADADPPPALPMLAQLMGLVPFEADVLLLCVAVELDPAIAALVASLDAAMPGSAAHGAPTFGLALQLFDDPRWEALAPHRPLRYAYLVDISQPGATPLTAAALRADERIVHYVKGLNALDERLATLLQGEAADERPPRLAPTQQAVVAQVQHQLDALAPAARVPLVVLHGHDGPAKLDVARAVCSALGRHVYRLALDALATARADVEHLARLWQRECLLLPISLYVEADELDGAPPDQVAAFHALLSRPLGLVFVGLREPPAKALPGAISFEVRRPTADEQCQAWAEALSAEHKAGAAQAAVAAPLAGQFDLNLRDIDAVAALARTAGDSSLDGLWGACCRATHPRLDQLAQRIDARAEWGDLVLADEAMQLLRRIAEQVRLRYRVYQDWGYGLKMNRGLGISALFAGESGTGKTMAAEVIANDLNLALYRIDLSAVVSKYIGETEKNLRRLFDAAEQGGAILFFDEADALFGKRSEVKDSHDRLANIEINYLLQRMESFSGLAILATNMKSALDNAFLRRLRFVVNFQFPGPTERKRMWQQALPPGVPRDEAIDFDRLARFNFSGGNIHSVALNAAFEAAAQGRPVSQANLLAATRRELRKLDRPVHEGEFR